MPSGSRPGARELNTMADAELEPAEAAENPKRKITATRVGLGAVGIAIIVATFAFFLPKIADYRDVWAVVKDISWLWIVALLAATALNLCTFAPPWMAALPGLRFWPALMMTQASTALSIVAPAGAAVGIAGQVGILSMWRFEKQAIARAVTLVSLWNQFANLAYPIVAVFALAVTGSQTAFLADGRVHRRRDPRRRRRRDGARPLQRPVGREHRRRGGALASWMKVKFRRQPVTWNGASFERFRRDAVELLRRRWHVLTLATFAGSLTVFLVLSSRCARCRFRRIR